MTLPDSFDRETKARSLDKTEAAFYDMEPYKKTLSTFVACLPRNPAVVDLGCGDGRMTDMLKGLGVRRVTSHVDVLEKPYNNQFDGVVMTEAAYCLEDPHKAYLNAAAWLKKGGLAVVSNPMWETYFVHALLNHDFDNIELLTECKYYHKEHDTVVHMLGVGRSHELAGSVGFRLVEMGGTNGHESLLLHALKDAGVDPNEYMDTLSILGRMNTWPGIQRLHISLYKKELSWDSGA